MKVFKIIFCITMFLPLPVTLIALIFLPDQIPAHYGFDNQVTRWGSKYETLILPLLSILMGLVMIGVMKLAAKMEQSEEKREKNEKGCLITGIASFLIFNVMDLYFIYTSYAKVENLSEVPVDLMQLLFILLGIFMVVIGRIMPGISRNSIIGLRTAWSMKNETVWHQSQRFGGVMAAAAGFLMIVVSVFTRGFVCFACSMGILAVMVPVDVIYTYRISKKY